MTLRTMIAVAPVVASLNLQTAASAADDPDAVSRLVGTLLSPTTNAASLAEHEEAALQLVNRDSSDAHAGLLSVLKNAANPTAQTAIAKALAQAANPPSDLIPILGGLLGPNKLLTEAAAAALANYAPSAPAFEQLRRYADASVNPEATRIAVIHAIGMLVDPDPGEADYLITLCAQPNQNQTIRDAATDALGDLTGITAYGKDVRKWQQWWTGIRTRTPDQFRASLLGNRVIQSNLLKQRNAQLIASASALLKNDYLAIPVNARDAVVMNYLNDRAPDIRIVGIELVDENFAQHPPPEGGKLRARLFSLIGDSDEKVRLGVMGLMLTLNDHAALTPLITQLTVEKDPKVKQLIAQALGKLADANAVPQLLALLQDPQPENVIAAAKAFTNLGLTLRQKDPTRADDVSSEIRRILKSQQNQPGTEELRAACTSALAALRDPRSFDTFNDCFRPGETSDVRRAALVGLGNLGNTNAEQTVANQLGDNDPKIRLEAARALRTVSTQAQEQNIFEHMNSDLDDGVRAALWEALQKLFDKEQPDQLRRWATQFDKDPPKKLVTLEKLGDALRRKSDLQAIAYNEQDIGSAMLNVKPPRIAEAIAHLQAALDYWRGPGRGNGESGDKLETLIGQILDDQLLAQQWTDATTFASVQIGFDAVYQPTVGPKIRDQIDRLKDTKPAEAQKLIDAALAMKPPLDEKYIKQIRQTQDELKQKPPPP